MESYPFSEAFAFSANDTAPLARGFGERGLNLNMFTRRERHRFRNGLEEEIYVLRRFLFTLTTAGHQSFPVKIEKSESPDFIMTYTSHVTGIEITEATDPRDQREFDANTYVTSPRFIGSQGGRFSGGSYGDDVEQAIYNDVQSALKRKITKINSKKFQKRDAYSLVCYANSNASILSNNSSEFVDFAI